MRDVAAAFRTKVAAGGVTVYAQGKVPATPTLPYCVVSTSVPRPGDYSTAAFSASHTYRLVTLYVGTSEDSALFTAEKVEAAILDKRLTVTGLNCSRMKREAGRPIAPDPDVESLVSGVDTWVFTTTNA